MTRHHFLCQPNLVKNRKFGQNLEIWWKIENFPFLTKFSIFHQIFYFWPDFLFLTQFLYQKWKIWSKNVKSGQKLKISTKNYKIKIYFKFHDSSFSSFSFVSQWARATFDTNIFTGIRCRNWKPRFCISHVFFNFYEFFFINFWPKNKKKSLKFTDRKLRRMLAKESTVGKIKSFSYHFSCG